MNEAPSASAVAQKPMADLTTSLAGVVTAVAGTSMPPPGGGSVAAAAGALAAALAQMVAGLTTGRPKYAHVADEMQASAQRAATLATELSQLVERDADAYNAVAAAYKLPKGIGPASQVRFSTLQRAMIRATETPLRIARASSEVAELAADIAERGNTNAVADAAVAVLLADAVCRAAALTVRVNVSTLADTTIGLRFQEEAVELTETSATATKRAMAVAERAF